MSDKGLSTRDVVDIIVGQNYPPVSLLEEVPRPFPNAVYIVKTPKKKGDLACDGTGAYMKHTVRSTYIQLEENGLKVLGYKKEKLSQSLLELPTTHRHEKKYSWKEANTQGTKKSTRIIHTVYDQQNLIFPTAIIQYIGFENAQDLKAVKAHGNAKKSDSRQIPYIRTQPSVITEIRQLGLTQPPKLVISALTKDKEDCNPSQVPRDRQQVYSSTKGVPGKIKHRNTGKTKEQDLAKMLSMVGDGDDYFLRDISFSGHERKGLLQFTFAMSTAGKRAVQHFCQHDSTLKRPLQIDMTYNIGDFYATCLYMKHPGFVHKNDLNRNVSMLVGIATTLSKTESDYSYMAEKIKQKTGAKTLIYGIDGETALERAMEKCFPIDGEDQKGNGSVKLRCFTHMQDNIKRKLEHLGLEKKEMAEITNSILGSEFKGVRTKGLVDSNLEEFDENFESLRKDWPKEFDDYMLDTTGKCRNIRDTLKWSMSREIRVLGGLGDPPNKFTNNLSEALHNSVKEGIYRQRVDQTLLHDLLVSNVIKPMEREMVRAIYNTGEYRLSKEYKSLAVDPLKWENMSAQQKNQLVDKVLGSDVSCSFQGNEDLPNKLVTLKLSCQPDDFEQELAGIAHHKVQEMWRKAEVIKSHFEVGELEEGDLFVVESQKVSQVKRKKTKLTCECRNYNIYNICEHVLVSADKLEILGNLLSSFSVSAGKLLKSKSIKATGNKPGTAKKGRKGLNNVSQEPIKVEIERRRKSQDKLDPEKQGEKNKPEEVQMKRKSDEEKAAQVQREEGTEECPDGEEFVQEADNSQSPGIYDLDLNVRRAVPFTAYFHNNNKFVLQMSNDAVKRVRSKKIKTCASCNIEVQLNAPAPLDVIFTHKERWLWASNDNKPWERSPTASREAVRFYCVKRRCILQRHPYFDNMRIEFDRKADNLLQKEHKDLLKREFNFTWKN